MTDIETIREALEILLDKANIDSPLEKKAAKALDALEKVERRYLPELPSGYRIVKLTQELSTTYWACEIQKTDSNEFHGYAYTPSAAVENAIKKIVRDE